MEFSWVQLLVGIGEFLLAAALAFVAYCALVSHLRFEKLADQAARGTVPTDKAAQGAEAMLAARLASSSRPFVLVLLEAAGAAPDGEPAAALEARLRALVRATDRIARGDGATFIFVIEARPAHGPALLARLLQAERAAPEVPLRGALVCHPADRGRAADLLALARRRLDEPPPAVTPVELAPAAAPAKLVDPLTGVLKAEHVDGSLQKYLARLREAELPFSVVQVDVDHLRRYNDQYGEPRGDRVLKALSDFLQRGLREDDLIARLRGGDEFMIALPATADQALAVGRRLALALRRGERAVQLDGLRVGISAGVAAWPQHGTTARQVLEAARLATRQAKARGRGQCVLAEGPPPATEYGADAEESRDVL